MKDNRECTGNVYCRMDEKEFNVEKEMKQQKQTVKQEHINQRRQKELSSGGTEITRKMLVRYICTLAVFVLCVVFAFILAKWWCSERIWYPEDVLYWQLKEMEGHALEIGECICLLGACVITCHFIRKWMGYLNEITFASKQLASQSEMPLVLSNDLKPIQDELNMVRLKALQNARHAKEAEQRKNDLVVYLAHDLKTPLTSVIGYLNLLVDEPDISMKLRSRYTEIALNKAERLEDLINEFFDITRFNLTAIELELESVNLSRMLAQIASEFEPVLAQKGLRWKKTIAPEIKMLCDPDKLMRVFDNLIRNAVNYSYPDTEIELLLKENPDEWMIKVINQGKNISKEKLDRIFDQFFRLDGSRASATGGAGLGLAISKEIVELHGGKIVAESKEESICFTVTFPKGEHVINP